MQVNVMCAVLGTANLNIQWCSEGASRDYATSEHCTENCPTGPKLGVSSENGIWASQRLTLYSGADTLVSMNPCPFFMEFIGLMWKVGKFDAIHDFRKVDFKSFQPILHTSVGLIELKLAKLRQTY